MLRRTMLAGLASLTVVGACSSSGGSRVPAGPGHRDLADTLAKDRELSRFNQWIVAAEYADLLTRDGPFTLFAPNDSAIAGIRPALQNRLLASRSRDLLRAVLDHHIVRDYVRLDVVQLGVMQGQRSVETLDGAEVPIRQGPHPRFGTANVVRPNIEAVNGLIHAIDQVLLPPNYAAGL